MYMTPDEIRLKQNPVLTSMLLGMKQSGMIATEILPSLPQKLASVMIARAGKAALRKYNLQRAPGTNTKRVNIKYEGTVYTVQQKAVDVPIPRELLREADESAKLNIGAHLDISQMAITTAFDVLALDYEIDTAELLLDKTKYPANNVTTLTGASKWSDPTSDPVKDIDEAREVIRQATGQKPNTLSLSGAVYTILRRHPKIVATLPSTILSVVNQEHLKQLFEVERILVGDAIWVDDKDVAQDVWASCAVLSYSPKFSDAASGRSLSMVEPAFGVTNVIEGNPFAEEVHYERNSKSWIYGATYERLPNLLMPEAGFLFDQPI